MFRRNADVFAVVLLCAAAIVCSQARQIVIRDFSSQRAIVMQRNISGPRVELSAPFCFFGLPR